MAFFGRLLYESTRASLPRGHFDNRMNAPDSPRLQHVTITFPPGQEVRVRGFYAGALGLREKPVPKVVKSLGWIWFDTGAPGVELHCLPDEKLVPAIRGIISVWRSTILSANARCYSTRAQRLSRRERYRCDRVFLCAILSTT